VELAQFGFGIDRMMGKEKVPYTLLMYCRFERVIFSNNYCEHLVAVGNEVILELLDTVTKIAQQDAGQSGGSSGAELPPLATVLLVGSAVSATGNHIRAIAIDNLSAALSLVTKTPLFSTVHGFPSVDFDWMPGPFVANVISGPLTRQGTNPALDTSFNMTI